MSSSDRSDRPAPIVLGLLVGSMVLVSILGLWSRQSLEQQTKQPNTAPTEAYQEQRGPSEGFWWPEFSARDSYAQWAMSFFALIATGTSILGVIWIRQTLLATKDTADQARRGNDIALRSVEAQQRPWLDIDVISLESIRTTNNIVSGSFGIKVNNISDFPAVSVHIWADMYFSRDGSLAGGREAEALVQSIEKSNAGMRGYIIFPNEDMKNGFSGLTAKLLNGRVFLDQADVTLSLVVGVIYKSAMATHWHHTAHVFQVSTSARTTFRFEDANHLNSSLSLHPLPGTSLIT
jgi:hypothetical protein